MFKCLRENRWFFFWGGGGNFWHFLKALCLQAKTAWEPWKQTDDKYLLYEREREREREREKEREKEIGKWKS